MEEDTEKARGTQLIFSSPQPANTLVDNKWRCLIETGDLAE